MTNTQTFTVKTTYGTNDKGTGKVTAKGHGRQRTVPYDHLKSPDANHGAALGALLNVLTDDRQRAMLRHPSAKKRVRLTDYLSGGRYTWTVKV